MKDETILINEIIGKTITDIRCKYGKEQGWLDTAECFIALDHNFYITIPYGKTECVSIAQPDASAKTIFGDLSDIPVYHVNKEGKTINEVSEAHKKRNIFNRFIKALFSYELPVREYRPYKVEYSENKLKYIINATIVDYLWEESEFEKGFFELDNGYLISEQYMAPQGTGLAGLHCYDSLNNLKEQKEYDLKRHSEWVKDNY